MAGLKLAVVLLLCMMLGAPIAQAALSCSQITTNLAPCLNYLRSGGAPSQSCCNGVKAVNDAAKTTPDRQAACKCMKSAAGSVSGLNPNLASGLPSKCNVNIPYKFSASTNCDR
ncbi:Non-specific lipid-transfer protein [Morella rubra]|uniref:Non-specific lipid-transfer protein n=1 Tax=Morella rubra TaxID=262757 RepID=A0A6A1WH23_9ROSI|nr:Non-specific lipid-transfer protein [Morella rubra]